MSVEFDGLVIDHAARSDIIVAERVIVELKTVDKLDSLHRAQVLSYLKASDLPLGLLLNFNTVLIMKQGYDRIVHPHYLVPAPVDAHLSAARAHRVTRGPGNPRTQELLDVKDIDPRAPVVDAPQTGVLGFPGFSGERDRKGCVPPVDALPEGPVFSGLGFLGFSGEHDRIGCVSRQSMPSPKGPGSRVLGFPGSSGGARQTRLS